MHVSAVINMPGTTLPKCGSASNITIIKYNYSLMCHLSSNRGLPVKGRVKHDMPTALGQHHGPSHRPVQIGAVQCPH